MIHPHTELRFVSPEIGYGVFATKKIPKGTVSYVKDSLEITLNQREFANLDDFLKPQVEKYSYIDGQGCHVVSWDFGKYVNHSCHYNTISTGYGFEIACRDIEAGEEITDEYGIFNIAEDFICACGVEECRGTVGASDFKKMTQIWDQDIQEALKEFNAVQQPLLSIIDQGTRHGLLSYLNTGEGYISVANLQYIPQKKMAQVAMKRSRRFAEKT